MSARPLGWDIALATAAGVAIVAPALPWTVFAVACLLGPGLAHGALDASLYAGGRPRFYGGYLAGVGASAALWVGLPTLALCLFVGLSLWHFGEAELAHYGLAQRRQTAFVSRGALLVGWPLLLHLPEAVPIVATMGAEMPQLGLGARCVLALILGAAHLFVLVRVLPRAALGRELLAVASALGVMTALPLLEGFAVWFGLAHAGAHLHALRGHDPHGHALQTSWSSIVARGAPTWLAALAGVGVLAWSLGARGVDTTAWASAFLGLAVLTTPHMLLVARWHRDARVGSAPGGALGQALG